MRIGAQANNSASKPIWPTWRLRAPTLLVVSVAIAVLGSTGLHAAFLDGESWTRLCYLPWLGLVAFIVGIIAPFVRYRQIRRLIVFSTNPPASELTLAAIESSSGVIFIGVGVFVITLSVPAFAFWMVPPSNLSAACHASVLALSFGAALAIWPSQRNAIAGFANRAGYVGAFLVPNTFLEFVLKSFGLN